MSKVKRHYVLTEATLSDGDVQFFVDIHYRQQNGLDFFSDRIGPFSTRREALSEVTKRRAPARVTDQRVVADLDDDAVDLELGSHNETSR